MKEKLDKKSAKIILLLLSFICMAKISVCQVKQPDKKLFSPRLTKGVNLSHYEKYWIASNQLLSEPVYDNIRRIHKAGFQTIRLPVAFDHFLTNDTLTGELLLQIDSIIMLSAQLQLSLIIVYHHGKLTNENHLTETKRITLLWQQIMSRHKNRFLTSVFFELYNEPVIEHGLWKKVITTIAAELRRTDANRYFIIGGSSYNSVDGLDQLGIIPDKFSIYAFHFYEPFFFTHQGASWQKEEARLIDIPYPYSVDRSVPVIFEQKDAWMQATLWKYIHENNRIFLEKRLKKAAAYIKRYPGVMVICSETGVIKNADEKSRNRYFMDVISIMRNYRIGWLLWDYDTDFSVLDRNGGVIDPIQSILLKN